MAIETHSVESHADQISALRARLAEVECYLSIDVKRAQQAALEEDSAKPGFWDDPQAAQAVMGEIARLRDDVKAYDDAVALLDEAEDVHATPEETMRLRQSVAQQQIAVSEQQAVVDSLAEGERSLRSRTRGVRLALLAAVAGAVALVVIVIVIVLVATAG